MDVVPCKDCSERELYCHSTCEKYSNWKKEHEELKAKISKERHNMLDVDRAKISAIKRMMKNNKK